MSNPLAIAEFVALVFEIFVLLFPFTLFMFWVAKDYRSNKYDKMQRAFKYAITRPRFQDESVPGRFRLLDFCLEAEVDAKKAKRYLQKQVDDFGGVVDVDAHGDLIYYFADAKAKFLESAYDGKSHK